MRIGVQSTVISVAVFLGSPIGGQLLTHCHKTFVGLQVFTGAAMPIEFIYLPHYETSIRSGHFGESLICIIFLCEDLGTDATGKVVTK